MVQSSGDSSAAEEFSHRGTERHGDCSIAARKSSWSEENSGGTIAILAATISKIHASLVHPLACHNTCRSCVVVPHRGSGTIGATDLDHAKTFAFHPMGGRKF